MAPRGRRRPGPALAGFTRTICWIQPGKGGKRGEGTPTKREENEPLRKPARGGRPSKKAAAARTPSRSSSWLVIPMHATTWPGHQRSRTPSRACDEKGRQQRAAAVNAGLGNALGSTRPHQKPEQLVLDGASRREEKAAARARDKGKSRLLLPSLLPLFAVLR